MRIFAVKVPGIAGHARIDQVLHAAAGADGWINNRNDELLLFRDADDQYYAVPRRVIDQYRVPAQHRPAVLALCRRLLPLRWPDLSFGFRRGVMQRSANASPEPAAQQAWQRPVPIGWIDFEQAAGRPGPAVG